jgi:hypothetical protein
MLLVVGVVNRSKGWYERPRRLVDVKSPLIDNPVSRS